MRARLTFSDSVPLCLRHQFAPPAQPTAQSRPSFGLISTLINVGCRLERTRLTYCGACSDPNTYCSCTVLDQQVSPHRSSRTGRASCLLDAQVTKAVKRTTALMLQVPEATLANPNCYTDNLVASITLEVITLAQIRSFIRSFVRSFIHSFIHEIAKHPEAN